MPRTILPLALADAVLEDMLWAFMGFEGKYIKAKRGQSLKHGISYVLNGRVEHALHELINRLLPIWYAAQLVGCSIA